MVGRTGSSAPFLVALAHRKQARRDDAGALCRSRARLWCVATGFGDGHTLAGLAGAADIAAAHALPAPALFPLRADGRMSAGEVRFEAQCVALGGVSADSQWLHEIGRASWRKRG